MEDKEYCIQETHRLFSCLKDFNSNGFFNFDEFKNDKIYFKTADGIILYGIVQWLRYIYNKDVRFIGLIDPSNVNPEIQIIVYYEKKDAIWFCKKTGENCYLFSEVNKRNTNYYTDSIKVNNVLLDFLTDFSFMGLDSNADNWKERSYNVVEALANADQMYLFIEENTIIEENGIKKGKPFIFNEGGENFILITPVTERANCCEFNAENPVKCIPTRLNSEEFEKLCKLAEYDAGLKFSVYFDGFTVNLSAASVYKAVLRKKSLMEGVEKNPESVKNKELDRKRFLVQKIRFAVSAVAVLLTALIVLFGVILKNPYKVNYQYDQEIGENIAYLEKYTGKNHEIYLTDYLVDEQALPITKIGFEAFADKQYIESVVINDSTKRIETNAFFNCKNLDKVDLKNVEEIGSHSFAYCKLSELVIPDTVKKIENNAFCLGNYKEVYVPDSVEILGKGALDGWEVETIYISKKLYDENLEDLQKYTRFNLIKFVFTDSDK